jgi:hypothetical protein
MHLTCRCGWQGDVAVPPEVLQQAEDVRNRDAGDKTPVWVSIVGIAALGIPTLAAGVYGYYTGGWIAVPLFLFGGFLLTGISAGILAVLVTLGFLVVGDWLHSREFAGGPHSGFRLSISTHNLLSIVIMLASVVVGFVLWARFVPPDLGSWGPLLFLGILASSMLVPRGLFQALVPARCPECGGPAYHRLGGKVGEHRVGPLNARVSVWSVKFTCQACGRTSDGGTE